MRRGEWPFPTVWRVTDRGRGWREHFVYSDGKEYWLDVQDDEGESGHSLFDDLGGPHLWLV
jgi:hypothetical protein